MAGLLVDPSFLPLKEKFNKKHHDHWADDLCEEQIVYACKDAYACYAIWHWVDFILHGLYAADKRKELKSGINNGGAQHQHTCW